MGTRSTIALEYADGTVDQVYCHWNGYLDHNGRILLEHYSDPFKLKELMELGDLSSLDMEIGVKHHFDVQVEDQCTFYGRDRDEEDCEAKRFKNFEDYKANHRYEEYEYILRTDGNWYVCQCNDLYELLANAIEEEALLSEDDE